ncbi:MAG: XisI protein [Anaerolineae bacterium]|nr:XisI protein [Anaerolineae bacterium]
MDQLEQTVKNVVFGYAGGGPNILVFPVENPSKRVYGVIIIDHPLRKRPAGVMIMARLIGDKVIIEEDSTDRPLVDAMVNAGIPREQIVLAYEGEQLADLVQP